MSRERGEAAAVRSVGVPIAVGLSQTNSIGIVVFMHVREVGIPLLARVRKFLSLEARFVVAFRHRAVAAQATR